MYIHHALPKDLLPTPKRPSYQIKKKYSPMHRDNKHKIKQQQQMKHSFSEKTHMHHILLKEKPSVNAIAKELNKPIVIPKMINSILIHKKREADADSQDRKSQNNSPDKSLHKRISSIREVVLCRMENKAIRSASSPFPYQNLSLIDPTFWLLYEGESKNNGIRHGFGTQYYVNGEKYMGFFQQNRASGQGTYYNMQKRVMGIWEQDKLREVILQL